MKFLGLHVEILAVLLLSFSSPSSGARQNTLFLQRSADDGRISSLLDPSNITENARPCNFDGGELVISHPMDLHPNDKFFTICNLFQKGYELMVDYINAAPRCGLAVGGKRYGLVLRSYGEDGSKWKAKAIAKAVVNQTDFFLAPYTSGISGQVSEVAHDAEKIMIAPGSYFTWVYENKPGSFGVLPLPELYMKQVVPMLAQAGAKTIQTVYEGGPGKQCEGLLPLALGNNMIIQGEHEMGEAPVLEDFLPIAQNMSSPDQNPDVVITCTYDAACKEWIAALRAVEWSPKAQVFSICVGLESFSDAVGTDAEFLIGMSPWDRSLDIRDSISDWTPEEYVDLFEAYSGKDAAYHAALGQATVSLLAQAIEFADTTDYRMVADALQTQAFETVFGTVTFDVNGQNKMDLIATQYDANRTVNVVYPSKLAGAELVYPMPTWAKRDCVKLSPCNKGGAYSGECLSDGTCECVKDNEISFGKGPTAACHSIPEEDMTYISPALKIFGYVLVGLQCISSIFFIGWSLNFRDRTVVTISQPIFLVFVAFGCMLMSLSIIPLAQEGGYRFEQDPLTREETPELEEGINGLDTACMAFPWLLATGFAITFSALFAKIVRVKKIMDNAEHFRRKKVPVKDVLFIMVIVMVIEFAILLSWQFVAPLQWHRDVITASDLGYPTKSVGRCAPEESKASTCLGFVISLFVINFACILAALILCYNTRKVKSDLNEAKFITASVISIFQVLLLAIPTTIIAREYTNGAFFMKSAATFIISMAVTMFIFVPKFITLHFTKRNINISELFGRSSQARYSGAYGLSTAKYDSRPSSVNASGNDSRFSVLGNDSGHGSGLGSDSGHGNEKPVSDRRLVKNIDTSGPGSMSSFNDFVVELLKFKTSKGHCKVPSKKGSVLGKWVGEIRKEYQKLNPIPRNLKSTENNCVEQSPAIVDIRTGDDKGVYFANAYGRGSEKKFGDNKAQFQNAEIVDETIIDVKIGDEKGVYFANAYGRGTENEMGDKVEFRNAEIVADHIRLDSYIPDDLKSLSSNPTRRFDRIQLLNSLGFEWDLPPPSSSSETTKDVGATQNTKAAKNPPAVPMESAPNNKSTTLAALDLPSGGPESKPNSK